LEVDLTKVASGLRGAILRILIFHFLRLWEFPILSLRQISHNYPQFPAEKDYHIENGSVKGSKGSKLPRDSQQEFLLDMMNNSI
jgi:hypothetical protein